MQSTNRGPRLVLRPDLVGRILDAAQRCVEQAVASNEQPILVCSPNIRFPLKKLVEGSVPNLSILAYSEIANGINISSLASLSINED
jgi:flagellar biosynthesis protein FlhA